MNEVIQQLNPLITCIMPTANRAYCMEQAVGYFLAQDYPNKELIIVLNTDNDLLIQVMRMGGHIRNTRAHTIWL